MRLFVFEYLTGGGLLASSGRTDEFQSLLAEGRAICDAVAGDFASIDSFEVTCLRDARLVGGKGDRNGLPERPEGCFAQNVPVPFSAWRPSGCRVLDVHSAAEFESAFDLAAAEAVWTLVIAPEIGGTLAERCRRVGAVGGRPLASSLQLIELASDKHATAEHLRQAGVPAPQGIPFLLGQPWPTDLTYPAIWKPRDGAGSQGLRFIEHCGTPIPPRDARLGRLEEFWPRHRRPHAPREESDSIRRCTPASVSFLCGPNALVALPPCGQRLDPDFHYLGGWLPLPDKLARRATNLARRAIETLPQPLGYLGVDLVLGQSEDGSDDAVIEINPRLTTSYIGLRAACRENLAAAMLAIALGQPYDLTFYDECIEFSAKGRVTRVG
jgi:tyramine---L-glutamate ligase